jgi:hypothetical protein
LKFLGQLFPYSLGNYLQIVLTHENVKSDHIGIYVKLHSCITDSKREDEDPKWNIHKCDLGYPLIIFHDCFHFRYFTDNFWHLDLLLKWYFLTSFYLYDYIILPLVLVSLVESKDTIC